MNFKERFQQITRTQNSLLCVGLDPFCDGRHAAWRDHVMWRGEDLEKTQECFPSWLIRSYESVFV